jgi:hypothetical protein
VIRAHLGWLGWWQTQLTLDVPRRARLMRLECVSADAVEVELTSPEPFPVRDALLELQIGDSVTSTFSRYADNGDLHTVIFRLTADQLAAVSPTDAALVRFDPGGPPDVWQVDAIDPAAATGCDV